jgi:peptidoglycan/xylan/chitin deacetylase (PgdA/CDA1 family)
LQKNGNLKTQTYLSLVLTLLLFSCGESDVIPTSQPNLQAGVVITFDDDFVDEWLSVHTILVPYHWKATFFVTRFNQLSVNQIQKLKSLKSYGHEIGGHGLNHLNAPIFISANGDRKSVV